MEVIIFFSEVVKELPIFCKGIILENNTLTITTTKEGIKIIDLTGKERIFIDDMDEEDYKL